MGAATLVTRVWGPVVGGVFAAMPLTSGPVSVFLYLEQGRIFAEEAAVAAMLGYGALTFFILIFVRLAPWGAVAACAGSAAAYVLLAWAFSLLARLGPVVVCVIVLCCISLVLRLLPRGKQVGQPPRPAWWDLPARMILAGGMVLAVTGLARALGPDWSGILSTYPVFITLMAVFALLQSGHPALCLLMRGFVEGLYGSVAFFFVLRVAFAWAHPALAYGVAACVSLLICGVPLWCAGRALRAGRPRSNNDNS